MTGPRRLAAVIGSITFGFIVTAGIGVAQDIQDQQAPHPWRQAEEAGAMAPPPPNFTAGQSGPGAMQAPQAPPPVQVEPPPNAYSVPATLTIRPGTYVTVRVNQFLSSDRNQQGDTFFASLAEPLIVDGIVVAQRGQTVRGRVTEAIKAGRAEGTSHLGIELTGLTLVDGSQESIHSQMVTRDGRTSVWRDAAAIGTTTALGAAIGAGVGWGRGAAIGAGAGAAAGILGVLLTRGHPTVVSPESLLTFEIQTPVTVATNRAPQAFRYAEQPDYGAGYEQAPPAPRYAAAPLPPPPAYVYGPGYYPYSWGPGFSLYFGSRHYYRGGGFYYGGHRGYRR